MLASSLMLVAQHDNDPARVAVAVLGLLCAGSVLVLMYFLPTGIARHRRHHNTFAIFLLNLLLGWSVVGWIVSLVWASTVVQE